MAGHSTESADDSPPDPEPDPAAAALTRLRRLVATLRGPDGCPWDRRQELDDLRSYLVEEAHEVAGAIDARDWDDLRAELGDLLFQVVFVSELAAEQERFRLEDSLDEIHRKMVDRHPHVFGDARLDDADAVQRAWERRKVTEERRSVLAGIPASLPALVGAWRIGQKAGGVGFDWPDAAGVRAKVGEELDEIDRARSPAEREEEIGDLLFAVAQWSRHLGVDPERALARANAKFRRRFLALEESLEAEGRQVTALSLGELEARWQEVKEAEREEEAPTPRPPSPR